MMEYEVCEISQKNKLSNKSSLAEISISLKALGYIALADEVASYSFVQSDKTLRVTVLGEYSAGKSTLINALLGKRLLASSLQPSTGIPAEVRYGKENVTVLFHNGTDVIPLSISIRELVDLNVKPEESNDAAISE